MSNCNCNCDCNDDCDGIFEVPELFGMNVFNDKTMKERLPKDTYKAIKKTIEQGESLRPEVADVIANAMKDWAIERGATHYTHWFQPLTGTTAEKHDSFISPTQDGLVIMEFSGKQLIQGEPDASSFPSGGLRATFEARGYTAWDCTSPAFLKEDSAGNVTLCIPTAFCAYHGEALDKKTPLLRSMKAVSNQALRVLRILGDTTATRVIATVGPEQEYFLIDKELYAQRLDIIASGRSLFGAPAPKGQELEDQYFGSLKDKISVFMKDLDVELWKMGITSKTKHNEVAPGQFEMAPVFSTTNISADQNQLVMETMQKVALRHDMVCLLHEKPFAGINGSGKHNNWSLSTDTGLNLLEPGKTPHENAQFLVFLSALIQAVDKHADIMRATCASAGNDHRLGANEAPPAIISAFLGTELADILNKIALGEKAESAKAVSLKIGVDTLPDLPKDNTDRNRTSPFAFTGNKFEFRMVGSSQSISGPNVALNTIVAESLDEIATRLEKASDVNAEIQKVIKDIVKKHGRIIFNGNNYSEEWVKEAEKRGLPNNKNCVDALKAYNTPKAIELFSKYEVLTKEELHSRYEIYLEQYSKRINIEAQAAIQMVRRQFIPTAISYATELGSSVSVLGEENGSVQAELLDEVTKHLISANKNVKKLEQEAVKAKDIKSAEKQAVVYRDNICPLLSSLRSDIDALEAITPDDLWPVPTYNELLFSL